MNKNRKCKCGEPIFRKDRDCCDSCFNTGITPKDNLNCVIIYGFDDYRPTFNPGDERFIGCSVHEDMIDLRFRKFKQVCCMDMKENFHRRFHLYNNGGYTKPRLHDINPTADIMGMMDILMANLYYTNAPEVYNCPYCGRRIELIEEEC